MDGPPQKHARSEVYGFVAWAASWVVLFAYAAWAFLPDSFLHPLGITYYPNRYWTYAAPLWLFLSWVFSLVVYFAYNLIDTAPLDSYYIITDEKARDEADALPLKERDEIPPIADVPITVVNDLLFPPLKKPSPNSSVSGSTGAPTLSFSQGAQARRTASTQGGSSLRKREHTRQMTS